MAFKVKLRLALETEVVRVKGILLMPQFLEKEWEAEELRAYMADPVGIEYTDSQWAAINEELHNQGIVQDVS